MKTFLRQNLILVLAGLGAFISMAAVPPSAAYLDYLQPSTLAVLFCLMAVTGSLRESGIFTLLTEQMLRRFRTLRQLSAALILACFFVSMWVTNDVSLLTFVPFALTVLNKTASPEETALVLVLQTIAANLGSMCTPVGNPQNLYLYTRYGMDFGAFILLLLPCSILSLLLLLLSLFFLPDRSLPAVMLPKDTEAGFRASPFRRYFIPGVLFLLSLLSVARLLDYRFTFAVTLCILAVNSPHALKNVDFTLLLTFVVFFIFVGNLSRIPSFRQFLTTSLAGHEFWISLLASQIISNVPAAILLSGFTDQAPALLLGTDIGGLGTLVASMASLISYGMYIRAFPGRQSYYLKIFTLWNAAYLAVLIPFARIFQGI